LQWGARESDLQSVGEFGDTRLKLSQSDFDDQHDGNIRRINSTSSCAESAELCGLDATQWVWAFRNAFRWIEAPEENFVTDRSGTSD
jgi:hypothetical protein